MQNFMLYISSQLQFSKTASVFYLHKNVNFILLYFFDIVLLAPSWHGLQQLLDIVMQQSGVINMSLNARKSVCIVFSPRDRSCFPES